MGGGVGIYYCLYIFTRIRWKLEERLSFKGLIRGEVYTDDVHDLYIYITVGTLI